jgi:hypothetical protein
MLAGFLKEKKCLLENRQKMHVCFDLSASVSKKNIVKQPCADWTNQE